MNGGAVEELQRARDDLGRDNVGNGLRRLVHLREGGNQGLLGRRLGDELEQHFSYHTEGAFRADEQVAQGVAGHVFHALVASPKHLAGRKHDFQPHDVIARDSVFEPAQATGVLGDVAADGGDLH